MVEMARDVKSPHFLAIEIKLILPPDSWSNGKLIFFYGCNPLLYPTTLFVFSLGSVSTCRFSVPFRRAAAQCFPDAP
ncbi:MAG: hypothetical protein ACPHDV_04740, partial [Parvibaculales bacterium]